MRARRLIERFWTWLGQDRRAIEILIALLLVQLTALFLPQSPVPATQSAVFTQWVAQQRPTLGAWVRPLTFLGLLTVRSSLLMRVMLSFLGVLVMVRIDKLRELWKTMRTISRTVSLFFCIGGALVIGGWAAQMVWGWAEPDIVTWPSTPLVIEEHNVTLLSKPPHIFHWTEKYGLYLLRTGWAVGLDITAADPQGNPLLMLRSSKDQLLERLQVIVTGSPPEAFFSTPETELVYRLHQLENRADAPLIAQVYRSASGELLAETPLNEGETLDVEDTSLSIIRTKVPRYRLVYNPGAPIELTGLIAIAMSAGMQRSSTMKDKRHPEESEEALDNQTQKS